MPTLGSMGLAQNEYSARLSAAEPQKAATLDELGRRLGMRIELVDSVLGGQANGQYLSGRNTMQIAADAVNPVEYVAAHEATHYLQEQASAEYGVYRDAAADYYRALYGEDGLNYMVEGYKQAAQEAGVQLDDTGAMDEIAADFTEKLMDDTDLFARFAADNRTAAQKLLDALKAFVAKVRATLTGGARDTAARNAYGTDFATLESIAVKWQTAFDAAAQNTETAAQMDGGARYSLMATSQGAAVVVDDDILSDIDTTTWNNHKKERAKKAAENALKAFRDGVTANGIMYKVNKRSRNEFTRSNETEHLYRSATDVFADKMRTAAYADEVIKATSPWVRDGELKHKRADNFVDFEHGDVLIQAGQNKYKADVVVGITDIGERVFYDVVNIVPTQFQITEEPPTAASGDSALSAIQGSSTADSIYPADQSVKSVFSLKNAPRVEYLPPEGITPMNDITNSEMYEYLEDDIRRNGYNGRPILVYETPYGHQALTGSHRTMAAKAAGESVPAIVVRDGRAIDRLSAAGSDEARAMEARELFEEGLIDEETRNLLIREDELNSENYGVPFAEQSRFSLKNSSDVEQELKNLKKEQTRLRTRNKLLEQRVQYLKGEMKVSKEPAAVADDVERLGRAVIQKYKSDAKYRNIQPLMEDLANTVLRGDASMEELLPIASEAAEVIVDNVSELTEIGADLQEIRSYLRQQKIKFDGDMNDYSNFRRGHLGTLKLSKAEGLPIDTVYDELTERFGEDYFPSGLYTEADKLQRIAEVLDNTEFMYENPYDAYHDDVVQEVAYELIEGAFDRVRQRITYADRRAEETRAAREEAERAVEELNKEREERKWQEKRANSLMSQAHSLYEEVQRLRGGPQKERAKPTMPQLSRKTGFAREAPQITSEPVSVPVTREQARRRMAEEAAARAAAEEQRKAVLETMQRVGVAPFGSEADYAGADLLILDELSHLSFNRHQSELLVKASQTAVKRAVPL